MSSKQEVQIYGKTKHITIHECKPCNFTCYSDVSKFKKHCNTKRHQRNINPPVPNEEPEVEGHRATDEVFCKYCNMRCLYIYYHGYHINSRKHKNNVLAYEKATETEEPQQ